MFATNIQKERFAMNEKEENIIRIVNYNIISFACDLGYSYLNAGDLKWENREGEVWELKSMRDEYLKNCVSFIERGIKELKNNFMDGTIRKKIVRFAREHDDDKILKGKHLECTDLILDNVRKSLIEELERKKSELEYYL